MKKSTEEILEQITLAFSQRLVRAEELPADDPRRDSGVLLGELYTDGVGFLASASFPSPVINKLMKLVWHIVGSKITPVMLGPEVRTVSFAVLAAKEGPVKQWGVIFLPHNWLELIKADTIQQLGALVYSGSQAQDFYNGVLPGKDVEDAKRCLKRARAYEAEYLHTVAGWLKSWTFTPYQQAVMKEYPEGVTSAGKSGLIYESKPFTN